MALTLSGSALGLGKVLQVIQGNISVNVTVTTATWTDTPITASITPSSASSKILVLVSAPVIIGRSGGDTVYGGHRLMRDSTSIFRGDIAALGGSIAGSTGPYFRIADSLIYLDSPATTSTVAYKTQAAVYNSTGSINVNNSGAATIVLVEVAP